MSDENLKVGGLLRSLDPRDDGRVVRIIEIHPDCHECDRSPCCEACVCMGGTAPCLPPFGTSGGCSLSDDETAAVSYSTPAEGEDA